MPIDYVAHFPIPATHLYGRALDFVIDGVIDAFAPINDAVATLLAR